MLADVAACNQLLNLPFHLLPGEVLADGVVFPLRAWMLQHVMIPFKDCLLLRVRYHDLAVLCCQLFVSEHLANILSCTHTARDAFVFGLRDGQRSEIQHNPIFLLKNSLLEELLLRSLSIALLAVQKLQQRVCNNISVPLT